MGTHLFLPLEDTLNEVFFIALQEMFVVRIHASFFIRKLVEFLVLAFLNFFLAISSTKTFTRLSLFLDFSYYGLISCIFIRKFIANFIKYLEQVLKLS